MFERCFLAQIPRFDEPLQLLQALKQCGDQLDGWLSQSPENALLFMEDQALAMQSADSSPELDLAVMLELEAVLSGLVRKLELPVALCPETDLNKMS
jgi:hypothetical protein